MYITHFKRKYFTNSFYWVNKGNYEKLQRIGLKLGCLNSCGGTSLIGWHEGFKNLGFRTYENITYFQKEPFLTQKETAVNFEDMLNDYKKITIK